MASTFRGNQGFETGQGLCLYGYLFGRQPSLYSMAAG